ELRLLPGGDQVEAKPGLLLRTREELRAVRGLATRLGRDGPQPLYRPARQVGRDRVQGGERPIHRRDAEASLAMEALAETDDAAEAVDDAEAVGGGSADE